MWPWFLALLLFSQLFAFHALLLFTLCAMLTSTPQLAEMLRHRILLLGRSVTWGVFSAAGIWLCLLLFLLLFFFFPPYAVLLSHLAAVNVCFDSLIFAFFVAFILIQQLQTFAAGRWSLRPPPTVRCCLLSFFIIFQLMVFIAYFSATFQSESFDQFLPQPTRTGRVRNANEAPSHTHKD